MCYRAYSAALLDIQHLTGKSERIPLSDAICLAVARRIIEASAYGERDAERLKQHGLRGSMKQYIA